jgi:hypothetical protein
MIKRTLTSLSALLYKGTRRQRGLKVIWNQYNSIYFPKFSRGFCTNHKSPTEDVAKLANEATEKTIKLDDNQVVTASVSDSTLSYTGEKN